MSRNDMQGDCQRLKKNSKALMAMGGGVNSAVAAALLLQRGCQVTSITMKIWDENYLPGRAAEKYRPACFGLEDST